MSPYRNDKNQLVIKFGRYTVIQNRKDYNAIYFDNKFLCHRNTWDTATKMAKMLKDAYDEGYCAGGGW